MLQTNIEVGDVICRCLGTLVLPVAKVITWLRMSVGRHWHRSVAVQESAGERSKHTVMYRVQRCNFTAQRLHDKRSHGIAYAPGSQSDDHVAMSLL